MRDLFEKPLFWSILGALLLFAGWPSSPLFPLLFVGMACFLMAANLMILQKASSWKYFGVLFLGLLTWNITATWWIYHATLGGMIMAVVGNSILMSIPFVMMKLAHQVKIPKLALLSFVLSWLCYEYIHHNWSLTWPWLTLGNGLAKFPILIQWYEYTGTAGGSLWILLINAIIFSCIININKTKIILGAATIVLPVLVSLMIYKNRSGLLEMNKRNSEVVVLQPNLNTYTQKSRSGENFMPYEEQLQMMIEASKTQVSTTTEFLVWPETAISGSNRESQFKNDDIYKELKLFLSAYPKLTLIAGFDSYEICEDQNNPSEFASYHENVGYYEPYNTALMMNKDSVSFYHKSKFVPGAEQIPFPWLIEPIELILGGVGFGQFVGQAEQISFSNKDGIKVVPSICYESIFGEHTGKFVQNGAELIFVVTNDDWWHDTEGHRQHFDYARLRAIETRLSVARSANTGFSGFIDALGNVSQKTDYRENACIKRNLDLELIHDKTFYVNHGDYLGKTASYIMALLLLSFLVKRLTPKN
jgi:apolipoprotein N-acyltransferase